MPDDKTTEHGWHSDVQALAVAREANDLMRTEILNLRAGIRAYLDGDYECPRRHRPGPCTHGIAYYETCEQCINAHFTKLLGDAP